MQQILTKKMIVALTVVLRCKENFVLSADNRPAQKGLISKRQ